MLKVHAAVFIQGDELCFFGGIDRLDRLLAMNRAFPKAGGFGGSAGLVVVILERQKQRQISIAVEGPLVGAQVESFPAGRQNSG